MGGTGPQTSCAASFSPEAGGAAGGGTVSADGAQGDGIYVAPSYGELATRLRGLASQTPTVVQHYLSRPLLLDGFKFDLRVYVFVASVQPLEVWVCREGLARFCTEKYVAPTGKNCHRVCAHLTNYSLNKHNADYVPASSSLLLRWWIPKIFRLGKIVCKPQ